MAGLSLVDVETGEPIQVGAPAKSDTPVAIKDRIKSTALALSGGDERFAKLATGLGKIESDYRDVKGPKTKYGNADGPMQVLPSTYKEITGQDISTASTADKIDAGVAYALKQYRARGGDVALTAASYNAGPGAVDKHGGVPPYKETQDYVAKARKAVEEGADELLRTAQAKMAEKRKASAPPMNLEIIDDPALTQPLEPAPIPKNGILEGAADTGLSAARGAVSGVKMVSDAFGADNDVSAWLDQKAKAIADSFSPAKKARMQERARIIKEAEQSGKTMDEIKAYLGTFADDPLDTVVEAAGTMVPTLAAAVIPGLREATALRVAAQLGIGAVQGAGAVKGQVYETVEKALLERGVPAGEAKVRAAEAQAYFGDNAGQIALGAALGAWASKTGIEEAVHKMMAGKATVGGLGKRVAMGIATEAIPEAMQGGQERLAANQALNNVGVPTPIMQGVAGSAALEGVAGGLLGGGMAIPRVQNTAPPPGAQPAPPAGPMTRAAQTAVDTGAAAMASELAKKPEGKAEPLPVAEGIAKQSAEDSLLDASLAMMERQSQRDMAGLRSFGNDERPPATVSPTPDVGGTSLRADGAAGTDVPGRTSKPGADVGRADATPSGSSQPVSAADAGRLEPAEALNFDTVVAASGKPFATMPAARREANKRGGEAIANPNGTGFVVRVPRTSEVASVEEAIKRDLGAGEQQIAKPEPAAQVTVVQEAPKPAPEAAKQPEAKPDKKPPKTSQRHQARLHTENPFLGFLYSHGLHPDEVSDVGIERPGKKRDGTYVRYMKAGFPPMVRQSGQRMDGLVERAIEAGFITRADAENGNGVERLRSMIKRAVGGERIDSQQTEEATFEQKLAERVAAENEQFVQEQADRLGLDISKMTTDEADQAIKDELERQDQEMADRANVLLAEAKAEDQIRSAIEEAGFDADESTIDEVSRILIAQEIDERAVERAAMQAQDDTDFLRRIEEIIRGKKPDTTAATADRQQGQGQPSSPASSQEGGQQDALESYTPEQVVARQEAAKASEAAKRAAEKKAEVDSQVDSFRLTGSDSEADQAMAAGQQSLLDQPAMKEPAKAEPEKPAEPAQGKPDVDLKGFEKTDENGGDFTLTKGNMTVKVEKTNTGLQASFRGAKSSPRLDEQGAVDWAEAYRKEAERVQAPEPAKPKKPPTRGKRAEDARRKMLEEHFAPGNIIRSDYWKQHDRVEAFDWNGGNWTVKVRKVKQVDGQWVNDGPVRAHSTTPDKRDQVVYTAPKPKPAPAAPAEPTLESRVTEAKASDQTYTQEVFVEDLGRAVQVKTKMIDKARELDQRAKAIKELKACL